MSKHVQFFENLPSSLQWAASKPNVVIPETLLPLPLMDGILEILLVRGAWGSLEIQPGMSAW